jgi:hypothetical protein
MHRAYPCSRRCRQLELAAVVGQTLQYRMQLQLTPWSVLRPARAASMSPWRRLARRT